MSNLDAVLDMESLRAAHDEVYVYTMGVP